ncbi:S24 family peptidase [Caballeronia sp. LZ033]|uniref:S24 family peptidase n=1 Tax=Caballeronia sp. LZ033 TaxID=3038566 RepID=UPI00285B2CAD|nr:S24 family peptidase [Caballeronia sp. LZ033]MDR5815825.1 S24 family peptidase [Caballeronia sp. LZ033]
MTTNARADTLLPMVEKHQLPILYPEFAERLTAALREKGLKVGHIVEYFKKRGSGISYEMVRRYTLGQAMPRPEKLTLLADAVGLTPQTLVFGATTETSTGPIEPSKRGQQAALFEGKQADQSASLSERDAQPGSLSDGRVTVNIRPILAWEDESELGEEYVLIPRLDIKVSAGNGRIVWEVDEKGQKQAFRRSWCDRIGVRAGQAATVVAEGSSMEPRVVDGDSLVVDYKAKQIIDGKVYVLAYQNEVYVKRLFKKPGGGLTIRSDNPDKARYPDMDVPLSDMEHVEIIARVVAVSGAM